MNVSSNFDRLSATAGRAAGILAVCLVCLSACVRTAVRGLAGPGGGVTFAPPRFSVGGQAQLVSACLSGDREYFLGVDLIDESRKAYLRVLMDPLDGGPRLMLFRRGTPPEVLGRNQCSELRASVQRTGWRVNHVRDVKGELVAECRLSDGQRLDAQLRFNHCH